MTDKIIQWPITPKINYTKGKVPVNDILLGADRAKLTETIVIGWDKEGEFYFASSEADGGGVLWLLEMAKKRLLEADEVEVK